jgi:hypothetical protein
VSPAVGGANPSGGTGTRRSPRTRSLAARREHVKTRASLDQPDDAVRDVDHLLEVVEEQQQALP